MTEANPDGVITEIRELNLSYLLLAQRLLREDRAMAMFRLGVSSEIAELIEGLTLAQTVKLAAVSNPLCRFRMDEQIFLSAIADKGRGATPTQMHAAILLSALPVEAFR
jgi:flagellar transcriptional activator FlhD